MKCCYSCGIQFALCIHLHCEYSVIMVSLCCICSQPITQQKEEVYQATLPGLGNNVVAEVSTFALESTSNNNNRTISIAPKHGKSITSSLGSLCSYFSICIM